MPRLFTPPHPLHRIAHVSSPCDQRLGSVRKGTLETLLPTRSATTERNRQRQDLPTVPPVRLAIPSISAPATTPETILDAYKDFEVRIHQQDRGVRLS